MFQIGRFTISGLPSIGSADGDSFVCFSKIHGVFCGSGWIMNGAFGHFSGYLEV